MKKITNTKTPQLFNVKMAEVKIPKIDVTQVQKASQDWVLYDPKHAHPKYLNSLIKKSSTHQSFIEKRQELIKSEGLTYSDDIAQFLEAVNEELESANDLLDLIATDLSILETFAVEVRYNKLKNKIVAIDYIPSVNIAPSKQLDSRGKPLGYWVCADWSNLTYNKPEYFERFNPKDINQTTQIFFYHRRDLEQPYLPVVSYSSALNAIETDYELNKFSLSSVHNGFFPTAVMSVKGSMTDEQREQFQSDVNRNFTGSENASKLMVMVSEADSPVDFKTVSTADHTAQVAQMKKQCIAEICTAHKGQPIIAGIQTDGSSLGSDGKLYRDSLEIYYNTVITKLQEPFLKFLKRVLDFNGYTDYQLDITSSALMTNAEVPAWKMDFLKPEVWLSEQGYTAEDIKPEMIDEIEPEPEAEQELPEVDENVTEDVQDNTGEAQNL